MTFLEQFNISFERLVAPNYQDFARYFYQNFMASSDDIATFFAQTDERRRLSMLEESLLLMMDFAVHGQVEGGLQVLAIKHCRYHINADHYDLWLSALRNTLCQLDKNFGDDEWLAWLKTLQPGIAYMKDVASANP